MTVMWKRSEALIHFSISSALAFLPSTATMRSPLITACSGLAAFHSSTGPPMTLVIMSELPSGSFSCMPRMLLSGSPQSLGRGATARLPSLPQKVLRADRRGPAGGSRAAAGARPSSQSQVPTTTSSRMGRLTTSSILESFLILSRSRAVSPSAPFTFITKSPASTRWAGSTLELYDWIRPALTPVTYMVAPSWRSKSTPNAFLLETALSKRTENSSSGPSGKRRPAWRTLTATRGSARPLSRGCFSCSSPLKPPSSKRSALRTTLPRSSASPSSSESQTLNCSELPTAYCTRPASSLHTGASVSGTARVVKNSRRVPGAQTLQLR
mmetsp:Transcript_54097/g.167722  ORF Transcript_54097/g.167722 Transcript_54097/m.167722 type:complete len:326 (-) Transcript_54097:183-1160(-)